MTDNCGCWGGGELLLDDRVGFDLVKQEVKKELRRLAFSEGLVARESWKVRLGGVLLCLGFSLWYEDQKSRGEAISDASW